MKHEPASFPTLLIVGLLLGTSVQAVDNNGPIDNAMAAGIVGEQADGFLGFVRTPTSAQTELQRRVNEVNIRRRGVYVQVARDSGETVDRVALLQAFRQITKSPMVSFFVISTIIGARKPTTAMCVKRQTIPSSSVALALGHRGRNKSYVGA
ncbi:MAG: YdbL family protein [Hyphomonadaceae bacterium]|nr:YdbL family protein [Hyphomonadaceae bacterium]